MRQFWAVMRDSYRESVDGWVINIMLVLSAVVIALIASISYEPQSAEDAIPAIVRNFSQFFADRGRDRHIRFGNCQFVAENVRTIEGQYHFQLEVYGGNDVSLPPIRVETKPQPNTSDAFRTMVATWLSPGKDTGQQLEFRGRTIAIGGAAQASHAEQAAVTPTDMEEFLANQFWVHAGLNAQVRYVKTHTNSAVPRYFFEVTLHGGPSVRGWPHTMKMFFGTLTITRNTSLGMILYIIEDQIINGLGGAIALLLGVIITSFFIPNMLRKGSVDLIISKPIGRMTLLIYKYIGGLIFIFIITTFTVGGLWLVLAIRSGHWDPRFLVVIPILTFTFAILYALSTLVGVVSRSAIASLLLTLMFMLFLYIIGQVKTSFDTLRKQDNADNIPDWSYQLVDTLNNVLPRYKDLDKLISKVIAEGTLTPAEMNMLGLGWIDYPSWWSVIGVSILYIAGLVGLAGLWFRSRDY